MTALAPEHATMPVLGRLSPHASRQDQVAHIAEAARQIRLQDLKLVHHAGAGHIGGDFSAIDVLATLYGAVLNVDPANPDDPERDRFILSKGHVAGALATAVTAPAVHETESRAVELVRGSAVRALLLTGGVAVLVGPGTYSSGEALAYHLQVRGAVRTFGRATPGAADHVTPVRVTPRVSARLPEAIWPA